MRDPRPRARWPRRSHLEDALGGEADALGVVQLAVLRLRVKLGEEGRVLRSHGIQLAADGADDRLERGELGREGLLGRKSFGGVGEAAETELDDLGRGERLLPRLLQELLRVDAREPVERLLGAALMSLSSSAYRSLMATRAMWCGSYCIFKNGTGSSLIYLEEVRLQVIDHSRNDTGNARDDIRENLVELE